MPTITRRRTEYRHTPESTWAFRKLEALRKPYMKPTLTIGPRDEEDVIEALCARNPYM